MTVRHYYNVQNYYVEISQKLNILTKYTNYKNFNLAGNLIQTKTLRC